MRSNVLRSFRNLREDRYGLLVVLGSLLAFSALWQVGFFIADTYALANGVLNVAGGSLELTRIRYSLTLGSQPGLRAVDGRLFARNYGQLVAAVPFVWFLRGMALIFDPGLLVAGGWSLLALAFCRELGTVLERPTRWSAVGAVVALGSLVANAAGATALQTRWLPLLALQLLGVVAATVVPFVLYRVLRSYHGPSVGLAVAGATVVASPLAFWATIPKRHVLTAALVVVVLGGFAASRETDTLGMRAVPYLAVAGLTWIHAFEGLLVFVALVPLELATARSIRTRRVAVLGVVFLVALTPFFLTNAAVTGAPLTPPRAAGDGLSDIETGPTGAVEGAEAETDGEPPTPTPTDDERPPSATTTPGTAESGETTRTATAESKETTDGTATDTADGSPTETTRTATEAAEKTTEPTPPGTTVASPTETGGSRPGFLSGVITAAVTAGSYGVEGIRVALSQPDRVWQTFVRSGRLQQQSYDNSEQETVDLSVLEAMPVLGCLLAVPVVLGRRFDPALPTLDQLRRMEGRRQTDLLAAAIAVTFAVFYMPTLPLVSQITVRYLLPLYPLGLYAVGRLPAVRSMVTDRPRWVLGSYLSLVIIGGPLLTGLVSALDPAVGEAMQFHALVNLTAGTIAAVAVVVETVGYDVDSRVGAVALAMPAASTTTLLVLMRLSYFTYGQYALPAVRILARAVSVVS